MSDPVLAPEDVPAVVDGLLSVGMAMGTAVARGLLRGDVEERLVEAGELAFEHLEPVLPAALMDLIARRVEREIAKHRAERAGLPMPDA